MEEKRFSDIPRHKPVIIYADPPVDELEALNDALEALDRCIDIKFKDYNDRDAALRKLDAEIQELRDSRKRLSHAITIIERSRVAKAMENPE